MKITIETIEHKNQRYNTIGDWQFNSDGDLNIKVSELGKDYMNFLVAIHELVEAVLCKIHGISEIEVDNFDKNFKGRGDPGESFLSPYFYEHQLATVIETILSLEANFSWQEYARIVKKVSNSYGQTYHSYVK